MESEIVFFYDNQLPEGSPNATRIVSLAKGFKEIGFHVVMVGLNKLRDYETEGIYEGVPYRLLYFDELNLLGGLNRIKRAKATIHAFDRWLAERQDVFKTKAIVYSGSMNGLTSRLIKLSKNKRIPIIYNWVEWFQLPMFSGTLGLLRYVAYLYEFHFQFPRFRNIIAISSLLESVAKKKRCNVIRIPTIVDIQTYTLLHKKNSEKLILAYAGKIANKDLMVNVFKSFELLDEKERELIELHLYGIDERNLLKLSKESDKWAKYVGKQIICEGIIPYSDVKNVIQYADFTVLLRKQWKNANAGFPTKVGESMAAGVPVIANITSDIGLYLHDGVEGLVSIDESPSSFANTIKRALLLDNAEKENLRINARRQAECGFNYITYLPQLRELVQSLEQTY